MNIGRLDKMRHEELKLRLLILDIKQLKCGATRNHWWVVFFHDEGWDYERAIIYLDVYEAIYKLLSPKANTYGTKKKWYCMS